MRRYSTPEDPGLKLLACLVSRIGNFAAMLIQSSERRIPILLFVGPFPPDEESLWRLDGHCGLHSKSMAAPTPVTSGEYAMGDRCQGVRSCEHPGTSNFILRRCVWPRLRLFKIP
jgi:hypothetical protein